MLRKLWINVHEISETSSFGTRNIRLHFRGDMYPDSGKLFLLRLFAICIIALLYYCYCYFSTFFKIVSLENNIFRYRA